MKVIDRPRVFQWLLRGNPGRCLTSGRDPYRFHAAKMTVRRDVAAAGQRQRRRSSRCALSEAQRLQASATTCASYAMPRNVKATRLKTIATRRWLRRLGLEHADWVRAGSGRIPDVHRQHQRYRHPQARASENGRRKWRRSGEGRMENLAYADQNQLLTHGGLVMKKRPR